MQTIRGVLGKYTAELHMHVIAQFTFALSLVELKAISHIACTGIPAVATREPHSMSFFFVAAAAVLLVHLLVQAEGAKRTCPVISNFTTTTIALSPPIRGGEEPALLLLVGFVTNDRSACQCSLHEVIRGRLKLKARGKRCEHHGVD